MTDDDTRARCGDDSGDDESDGQGAESGIGDDSGDEDADNTDNEREGESEGEREDGNDRSATGAVDNSECNTVAGGNSTECASAAVIADDNDDSAGNTSNGNNSSNRTEGGNSGGSLRQRSSGRASCYSQTNGDGDGRDEQASGGGGDSADRHRGSINSKNRSANDRVEENSSSSERRPGERANGAINGSSTTNNNNGIDDADTSAPATSHRTDQSNRLPSPAAPPTDETTSRATNERPAESDAASTMSSLTELTATPPPSFPPPRTEPGRAPTPPDAQLQRYADFAAELVEAFAKWHDSRPPIHDAGAVAVAARQKQLLRAFCRDQSAERIMLSLQLSDSQTVRARTYTRLARMQLAGWIAVKTEAFDARVRSIDADADAAAAAGRTHAALRGARNEANRRLKALLTPVEMLALASDMEDKEKLKKRIQSENRYGVRVVRMVEQFGLGVVAFRGAMLLGEKYVYSEPMMPGVP